MWDCITCGVRAIAGSLLRCPKCGQERDDMPKTTVGGGGTNAREPNEAPVVAQDTPGPSGASEAVSGPSDAEVVAPAAPPAPPEPPQPPAVTGTASLGLPPLGAGNG
jgi:hypothetical protein